MMDYSKDMALFGKMGMVVRRMQKEMSGQAEIRQGNSRASVPQNLPYRYDGDRQFRLHNLPFQREGGLKPPQNLPHGMPKPPMLRENLLVLIGENPEGIRQKDLADRAGINQSSASEAISKLEDNGYLERVIDVDDRRATRLFLTEKGKARAAEVKAEREERFTQFFSPLTENEKQVLSDILDKLLQGKCGRE